MRTLGQHLAEQETLRPRYARSSSMSATTPKFPTMWVLSSDRKVLKALEKWHPGYLDWWNKLIPQSFQESMVYLRTAVSVDPKGWAKFDYVRMPEYRWGVLFAPQVEDRVIPCGEHKGQPAWQEVPGEYRKPDEASDRHSGRYRTRFRGTAAVSRA